MYRRKAFIKLFLLLLLSLNVSAFDHDSYGETLMIFKGIYVQKEDPKMSMLVFEKLYDDTNKTEYLKESIKLAYLYGDKDFTRLIERGKKPLEKDSEYLRMRVGYLLDLGNLNEALALSKEIAKLDPTAQNYSLLGVVQGLLSLNSDALASFREAFKLEASEQNFLRIINLLVNRMGKTDDAIKEMETYRAMYGCSAEICMALADLYVAKRDIPNTIKIYEELYKITNDPVYVKELLGFYLYFEDLKSAKELLERTSYDDRTLVEIYIYEKEYDKAFEKAKTSYRDSNNSEFLALAAIIKHEQNLENLTEEILKEVIDKFEKSVGNLNNAMYDNYYGYLLIDHSIDVPKGINLVEKALKKEPTSPYYLDSLAWGYYKLGQCEKADSIMKSIDLSEKSFFESKEAIEHIKAIEECLKQRYDSNKTKKEGK
ncbi:MAG: hypothetical protein GX282_03335 [Campylobacteraceae bacterium]|nr:hypothetical protein [Campylobacteraceae bacterium]